MADSYPRVLVFFTVIPIALLLFALRRRLTRAHGVALLALLVIVYAATTPWDNVAVARGYWGFDRARTLGVWLIYLPIEEYLFFGLQSVLAALVLFALLGPPSAQER